MMSSRQSLMRLTCEVLRLKLKQAHLVTTGNKADIVERLLQHEARYVQGSSGLPTRSGGSESTVSDSTDDTDDADQDETTSRYSLTASNQRSSETSEDSLCNQAACEALDVAPPRSTRRKHQRPERPAVSQARRTLRCSAAGAARISQMHSITAHGKAHSPDDSAISSERATSKGARQHPSKSKSSARKRRRRRSTSSASSSTSSSFDSSSSSGSSSPSPATPMHGGRSGSRSPSGTRGTITPSRGTVAP